MSTFPFDKYNLLSLSVERPKPDLHKMLKTHGFHYVGDHGDFGDRFYVNRQKFETLIGDFCAALQRVVKFGSPHLFLQIDLSHCRPMVLPQSIKDSFVAWDKLFDEAVMHVRRGQTAQN